MSEPLQQPDPRKMFAMDRHAEIEKAIAGAAELLRELALAEPGTATLVPAEWEAAPVDLLHGALRLAQDLHQDAAILRNTLNSYREGFAIVARNQEELLASLRRIKAAVAEEAGQPAERAHGGGAARQEEGVADIEWLEYEKAMLGERLNKAKPGARADYLRGKIRRVEDEILRLSDPAEWATKHATGSSAASD